MSDYVDKIGNVEKKNTTTKAFAEHAKYVILCDTLDLMNGKVAKRGETIIDDLIPNLQVHIADKRVVPVTE